jgi:hypothetical protein
MMNDNTIESYVRLTQAKLRAQLEQLGVENPDEFFPQEETEKNV